MTFEHYPFDAATADYRSPAWDVGRFTVGRVQFDVIHGAMSTGVVTIEQSADGLAWAALDVPVTFSASGLSDFIDLAGVKYLSARTTTAESGIIAKLTLTAKTAMVARSLS